MKISFRLFAALLLCAVFSRPRPALAARQIVVVVVDGFNPQLLDLGRAYLRRADENPSLKTAFDTLNDGGKRADASGDAFQKLHGWLETAAKNGFKTGLVTTGDLTVEAPLFTRFEGDAAGFLLSDAAKFNFLAGGGRAKFAADTWKNFTAAGNTFLSTPQALDGDIAGRVLAPQADGDLDFALDRDPGAQAGLGELANLSFDSLSANDAPFVLVIHDTLIKKALETCDTPALFEQFRELNAVLTAVLARRDEHPDLGLAVLATGSAQTPRFTNQNAESQQNALFVISNLALSYGAAGRALQGADDAAIAAFTNPNDGQYKGLTFSPALRAQISSGKITSEAAIRAAYEPALGLTFAGPAAPPLSYVLGFDAPNGVVAALQSAVATPAK